MARDLEKQIARQEAWRKEKYGQITLRLPIAENEKIRSAAEKSNKSVTAFCRDILLEYIKKHHLE